MHETVSLANSPCILVENHNRLSGYEINTLHLTHCYIFVHVNLISTPCHKRKPKYFSPQVHQQTLIKVHQFSKHIRLTKPIRVIDND